MSFLIPSSSGLATLSMPIMAPLADFGGVGRDLVVTAFQSASGLVNLITPLIRATPVLSVMTDDLGYLSPAEDCPCGIRSPYLTILGRVGLNDITTCAAGAAAILGKGEGL